jgi:hypothetical protein
VERHLVVAHRHAGTCGGACYRPCNGLVSLLRRCFMTVTFACDLSLAATLSTLQLPPSQIQSAMQPSPRLISP